MLSLQNVPYLAEKELDYEKYHNKIAQCDTMMVLYEPSFAAEYFPWGDKSSSGIIPALVAYNLPSIMHSQFFEIYKHQLTAPVELFHDKMESKREALKKMMELITLKVRT